MQLTFPSGDTITLPTFAQMRDWYRARQGTITCAYGGEDCLIALPVTAITGARVGIYPSVDLSEGRIAIYPHQPGHHDDEVQLPEAFNDLGNAFDHEMFDRETGVSRSAMPYAECALLIERLMKEEQG